MAPTDEVCPESTAVYRAAAMAYRNLGDSNLTTAQITALLEGPGGYLYQYEQSVRDLGCTKANAQVFSNAITAAIDAASEIGVYTGTTVIVPEMADFVLPPLLTALGYTVPTTVTDPALMAFYIINIMLYQYEQYVRFQRGCYTVEEVGEIFAQAFRDIFTSLLTTMPHVDTTHTTVGSQVVDLTYISAIAHYVDVQLGIRPAIPIISYNSTNSVIPS